MKKKYKYYIKDYDEELVVRTRIPKKNRILIAIFSVILCASITGLGIIGYNYLSARKTYVDTSNKFTIKTKKFGVKNKIDFAGLKKINPDVVGWIDFKNEPSVIKYPVVKGKDNDYYLTHTFDKKRLGSASIFMDCINNASFYDYNTILYGHNMNDKSMFAGLRYYVYKDRQDYFNANSDFYIYAPLPGGKNVRYKYHIFSAYTIDAAKDKTPYLVFTQNGYNEDYINWAEKMQQKSVIKSVYDIRSILTNSRARIITMSTCTNTTETGRIIVHAVLTDTIEIQ